MTTMYAANYYERTAPSDYTHARQGDRRAAQRKTVTRSRIALRRLQKN